MSDLADFLLEQIDEDEAIASEAAATPDGVATIAGDWEMSLGRLESGDLDGHVSVHSRRVLAECEAKRAIIAKVGDVSWAGEDVRDFVLEQLALAYADHSDYRPEWRPDQGR